MLAGKPYIHAGVVGFAGQVMTVIPGEGPCYRCIFRDLPAAGEIPTCKESGVLGAVVGVIGSLEATEAVKLIAGVGEPLVAHAHCGCPDHEYSTGPTAKACAGLPGVR